MKLSDELNVILNQKHISKKKSGKCVKQLQKFRQFLQYFQKFDRISAIFFTYFPEFFASAKTEEMKKA